jgi:hypothetical protein
MNNNEDFFNRLADSSFEVEVVLAGSDEPQVVLCRELPFGTLTTLVTTAAKSSREEMSVVRHDLAEIISNPGPSGGLGRRMSVDTIAEFIQSGSSAVIAVLSDKPELFNDVLRDIVIGSTSENISNLPMPVVIDIFSEMFDRLDSDLIADKLYKVFSKAAQITKKIKTKREEALPKKEIPTKEERVDEED